MARDKAKYEYDEQPVMISKGLHKALKSKAQAEGVFLGHLTEELIREGLKTYAGNYRKTKKGVKK